jgi:hypothetical protein
VKRIVLALGGGLLAVLSCTAHTDQKCVAPAAPSPASGPGTVAVPGTDTALAKTLLAGIPRPAPKQFATPQSVLAFLFQQIANRGVVESLAAFPVVEHYERVTIKDYVKYTGMIVPGQYPLDDDWYDRLSHALAYYMSQVHQVALGVLTERAGCAVSVGENDLAGVLHELDGARLRALQVVAMKPVQPESPRPLNPIDQAIGVTEKKVFEVTVRLENREVRVVATVGRVGDNWRVLLAMI